MPDENAFWKWSNRIEFAWSLVERTAIYTGFVVMLAAGPTGHAIGGLVALYYVIPLAALGLALLVVGFKRQARRNQILFPPAVPRRREYVRERINIVELAAPYGRRLKDLTFVECEIVGPAVLCGAGGHITMDEPTYNATSDLDEIFVDMEGRPTRPAGMIGVSDCIFRKCEFYSITWALPEDMTKELKSKMRTPNHAPAGSAKPETNSSRS